MDNVSIRWVSSSENTADYNCTRLTPNIRTETISTLIPWFMSNVLPNKIDQQVRMSEHMYIDVTVMVYIESWLLWHEC